RLITSTADEHAVFTENRILENFLFDFSGGHIQSEALSFLGHNMPEYEIVENLTFKMERAHHLRCDLAPHPIDVGTVGVLKFASGDAVFTDGSNVIRDTDVRKIPGRNVE